MKSLIVGIGALGGVIGARLLGAGVPIALATRDARAASALQLSGLHVGGIGGDVHVTVNDVRALSEWPLASFDLVVLATKADDALAVAPQCAALLRPGGALLPIQNGAVSQVLAARIGGCVLGGLSNLGATMVQPGVYQQRNAGHILLGELVGGLTERVIRVAELLRVGIEARATANMSGAIWSKLLLNCSVTTLGAIAGATMREYIAHGDGRALFDATYDEALAVGLASGVRPERMLVEPVPPTDRRPWLDAIVTAYGDLRPSMLQDFERRRPTEIEFINGYVAERGWDLGVSTKFNASIANVVRSITRGERSPSLENLRQILHG